MDKGTYIDKVTMDFATYYLETIKLYRFPAETMERDVDAAVHRMCQMTTVLYKALQNHKDELPFD